MSDLISRQDAVNLLYKMLADDYVDGYAYLEQLRSLPSAEPEPKIIHCKDCKFYTPMNRKLKTGICSMTMHHLGDDGFCSTAEKRGKND